MKAWIVESLPAYSGAAWCVQRFEAHAQSTAMAAFYCQDDATRFMEESARRPGASESRKRRVRMVDLDDGASLADARADLVKAGPLAAFGIQCIEWFATDGARPLSPSTLYTGASNGPEDDETFQSKARKLLGRPAPVGEERGY